MKNICKILLLLQLTATSAFAYETAMLKVTNISKYGIAKTTIDGHYYGICSGSSSYCPSTQYISVDANKEIDFDVFDYEYAPRIVQIDKSCYRRKLTLKPNEFKTILIVGNPPSNIVEVYCQL